MTLVNVYATQNYFCPRENARLTSMNFGQFSLKLQEVWMKVQKWFEFGIFRFFILTNIVRHIKNFIFIAKTTINIMYLKWVEILCESRNSKLVIWMRALSSSNCSIHCSSMIFLLNSWMLLLILFHFSFSSTSKPLSYHFWPKTIHVWKLTPDWDRRGSLKELRLFVVVYRFPGGGGGGGRVSKFTKISKENQSQFFHKRHRLIRNKETNSVSPSFTVINIDIIWY